MWRDTGLSARFFFVDYRATVLLLIALYHVAYWTVGMCVVGLAGLAFLENKGYTIPNGWRTLQVKIMGKKRPAVTSRRRGRSDR